MSFFRGVLNLFRSPLRYVGRDLEGNRFFEHPSTSDDPRRTKRTVQYKHPEDVWKYIGGGKRLPVQWTMWLSHTRNHPPPLEELEQDLERQRRVLANAAVIEARDLKERRERLQLEESLKEETTQRPQLDQPHLSPSSSEIPPPNQKTATQGRALESTQSSSPTRDEPNAWSPRAIRRSA